MTVLSPILPTEPKIRAQLTIGAVQKLLATAFETAGLDTPALDARLLVTGVLGLGRAATLEVPERPVGAGEAVQLEQAAVRRLAREPVSRILGKRQFYGLDLEIGPATLDPRPETETLVEGVLRFAASGRLPGGPTYRIADVGTGSGAILLSLLSHLPQAQGIAVDLSSDALAVAESNARQLCVADRFETVRTNWLDGVTGRFHCIVSNPPYIPGSAIQGLEPEVVRYDPCGALDGGPDGLDAFRALVPAAARRLEPSGLLALEIGADQEPSVRQIIDAEAKYLAVSSVQVWTDLARKPRCVAVQARS